MNKVMQNYLLDTIYALTDEAHRSTILDLIVSTLFMDEGEGSLYSVLEDYYSNNALDFEIDQAFMQLKSLKEYVDENENLFRGLYVNQEWDNE